MSRIVSVWLPRWPILRALAAQTKQATEKSIAPDRPFVLVVAASGGPRIAALNEAAEAAGLAPGEPLADARAKAGFLQVRDADPAADDAALRKLALWATRYTPTVSPWNDDNGADGFFLDIEGASHLFGGEEKLIADLAGRLEKNFGLPARIAVADTAGAAWALSRFHRAPLFVLPSGQEAAALSPLPIAALRLTPETRSALRRLGFKTVGALLDKPRAPFAARFPIELLRRIDQALGRIDEPLVPIIAPPVYHCLRYLLEPIFTQEAVVAHASRLMQTLTHVLARDDVGARRLRLVPLQCRRRGRNHRHRADAADTQRRARGTSHRSEARCAGNATRDAGFGFETIGLAVTHAEPMPARQTEFCPVPRRSRMGDRDRPERCAALIDALRQRLGTASVRRFAPVASHIPERAEMLPPIEAEASAWPEPDKPRPLLLLPKAEPAKVTALVPDGPPRQFFWRGVTHEVSGAEGPERIAERMVADAPTLPPRQAEEGKGGGSTRDYYLVEDKEGQRFWLYREGIYGRETTDARWFVHGLFA